MNLIPFVSSNLCAARISPRLPSLIRSERDTPWFWYFFATETTKRRFDATSFSSASWSFCRIRWASRTSSSREMSGNALMSRRYWSSDPSSYDDFLRWVAGIRRRLLASRRCGGRVDAGGRCEERGTSMNTLTEPMPADIGEPREAVRGVGGVTVVDEHRLAANER